MSIQAITCAMALREVTPSEKLLLLALANYADEHMRCYPSQRRLAEDTCLSDRTIRTLLAALETRRLLSRQERTRSDGSRGTDLFTLHFAGMVFTSISGGAEMTSGGVGKPLPGGGEMASALTTFEPSPEPSDEPVEAQAPSPKVDPRGCRLPDDWFPSVSDIEWAEGFTPQTLAVEADKFRDYWRAVPGAKGRKLDWPATWRNWVRRAAENQPRQALRTGNVPGPDHKLAAKDANLTRAFAGADAAADFLAERRRSGF